MTRNAIIACCFAFSVATAQQESGTKEQTWNHIISISAVRSTNPTLVCENENAATQITVQIYFSGLQGVAEPRISDVFLGVRWTDPPRNLVQVEKPTQTARLKQSPAVVTFNVRCTKETHPGKIGLGAEILKAPQGVAIKSLDPKNSLTELSVVTSQNK